jgi:multidrug efflux pump subunit AcrB
MAVAIALEIDRAAASRLGVTMVAIDETLNNSFSQHQIPTVYGSRNQWRVVMGVGRHTCIHRRL